MGWAGGTVKGSSSVRLVGWVCCLLEALLHQARPVPDRDGHAAAVDIVELLRIGPVGFDVVDFEADVWGDPVWVQ